MSLVKGLSKLFVYSAVLAVPATIAITGRPSIDDVEAALPDGPVTLQCVGRKLTPDKPQEAGFITVFNSCDKDINVSYQRRYKARNEPAQILSDPNKGEAIVMRGAGISSNSHESGSNYHPIKPGGEIGKISTDMLAQGYAHQMTVKACFAPQRPGGFFLTTCTTRPDTPGGAVIVPGGGLSALLPKSLRP